MGQKKRGKRYENPNEQEREEILAASRAVDTQSRLLRPSNEVRRGALWRLEELCRRLVENPGLIRAHATEPGRITPVSNGNLTIGRRENWESLAPFAQRLYQEGRSAGDVMRAIYGVDLPSESYVFHHVYEGGLEAELSLMTHPWELIALANGRDAYLGDTWAREQEERAFAQHPHFLPLMYLPDERVEYGEYVIGYDLDALRVGMTTILAHAGDLPATGAKLETVGTSLLAVLHKYLHACFKRLEYLSTVPWDRNYQPTSEDVEQAAEQVQVVEAMQKTVAMIELAEPWQIQLCGILAK